MSIHAQASHGSDVGAVQCHSHGWNYKHCWFIYSSVTEMPDNRLSLVTPPSMETTS
jgi:hypothetical protein